MVGKYSKTKKGKAHPNAIKLLNSLYNSLEKVVQLKGATEGERQKILSAEVERFKSLKAEIAQKKAETTAKKASSPKIQAKPKDEKKDMAVRKKPGAKYVISREESLRHDATSQAILAALEEIKDFISGEFNALRAELKHWRKEGRKSL